jgi:hypothetical protein
VSASRGSAARSEPDRTLSAPLQPPRLALPRRARPASADTTPPAPESYASPLTFRSGGLPSVRAVPRAARYAAGTSDGWRIKQDRPADRLPGTSRSRLGESNPRPTHYEDAAQLLNELHQHREHNTGHQEHSAKWANAIRHARTHARASARPRTRRVGGRALRITASDTGIGLPAEWSYDYSARRRGRRPLPLRGTRGGPPVGGCMRGCAYSPGRVQAGQDRTRVQTELVVEQAAQCSSIGLTSTPILREDLRSAAVPGAAGDR